MEHARCPWTTRGSRGKRAVPAENVQFPRKACSSRGTGANAAPARYLSLAIQKGNVVALHPGARDGADRIVEIVRTEQREKPRWFADQQSAEGIAWKLGEASRCGQSEAAVGIGR